MAKSKKQPGPLTKARIWLAAKVLLSITTISGAAWAIARADAHAAALRAAEPPTIEISYLDVYVESTQAPGTWPPPSEQSRLLDECYAAYDVAASNASADVLSDAGLAAIAAAVADSGWASAPPCVARTRNNTIVVTPQWLVGAAVLRGGDFDYLVSDDARPLPLVYRKDTTRYPAILGPASANNADTLWSTRTGIPEPIRDDRLVAALAVLNALRGNPGLEQIDAIDTSRYPSGPIDLVTDRDTRVTWGAPPSGVPAPGEVSTEQKLQRLTYLATNHDHGLRIDAGRPTLAIHTPQVLIDMREPAAVRDQTP